ncbi:hypothetical protein [Aquirufa ecclesiirivi]|uniref:hypothetical protein n=1 Tax=Aquirufa ecclesiirivi TaxID=2715124 RepID=UPI0023D85BC7|nr:hypothetical protein [Aquirufa ecclesiirivi]MDF0692469.1 hypothetical protein [Aquirufa ecclesiirivi]
MKFFKRNSQTLQIRNSYFILFLFISTLLFQTTGLKYIWSLLTISTIVNFSILVSLLLISLYVIQGTSFSVITWKRYLIPSIMIFGGMAANIIYYSFQNIKIITQMGNTLPWLYCLSIPYFIKKKAINIQQLWKWYYYFIVIINLLSLLEYYSIYLGNLNFKFLETPYGPYIVNNFSWLYMTPDGLPHFRYYACFYEPGTLAMFLLPAISYAFFYKKYIGLLILLGAFYFTFSLGGMISLFLLALIIIFISFARNSKFLIVSIFITILMAIVGWWNLRDQFITEYEEKGNSSEVREQSFVRTIENIPGMLLKYPFGIEQAETTNELEKNENYIPTNFIVGYYINTGGFLALLGYLVVTLVTLKISIVAVLKGNLLKEDKVIFSSLIVLFPFIFQRSTIWESGLFALMFVPSILLYMNKYKRIF